MKRALKEPSDVHPTAKQTSLTDMSPRRSSNFARSTRRVKGGDVKRLRVLPVHQIASAAQVREVLEILRRHDSSVSIGDVAQVGAGRRLADLESRISAAPARKLLSMSPDQPRTGARSPRLVPLDVRAELEQGAPSVNHMEQMAIDMGALLTSAYPHLAPHSDRLRKGGLVVKMRAGGEVLFEALGQAAWEVPREHRSDSVRGWGAMAIAACPTLSIRERISHMKPFADDPHFAVREWAWLALRPHVIAEPLDALGLLEPLVASPSPRLRRFASEATRPRGVWSAHIPLLKAEPEHGSHLLRALRDDQSAYVQNSVGNWLNDASKSKPRWVRETCETWLKENDAPATRRICARGMRTLERSASSSVT